ncbi:ferritin-like domain-containing protein [Mycobacterium sp. pW049]|uniref:ferritin-like domain-containing protein n=1 Tax=[Mycobacterium] bulgaricum TaxID=3238985 RepID=UPI00351BE392
MTKLDLKDTLATIKSRQWMLSDIDWDAPGAELIREDQRENLKSFMADLMWIEHVGARAFAGLALHAPTEELKEIYRYFHAEEQKHANAELALMKRWGLLEDGEIPLPGVLICHSLDTMDKMADTAPFEYQATIIPMLEVALDGALLKFLTDEVQDPLLKVVLNKINADESRHLAVGFHVMGMLSGARARRTALVLFKILHSTRALSLRHVIATLPIIGNMREELYAMGLDGSRLSVAMDRYRKAGERDPRLESNTYYKIVRAFSRLVMERHPVWSRVEAVMIAYAKRIPKDRWPQRPSWSEELTYKTAV